MTITSAAERDGGTPIGVRFGPRSRQKRWTVFFRYLLVIPQLIVLYVVSIVAGLVTLVGWFAALFTGRLPDGMHTFLTGYVRWSARVQSYALLLTDEYPPFSLEPVEDYPVDVAVRGGRLNRLAVLFRIVLIIPAYVVVALAVLGMGVFSFVTWVATLIVGTTPQPLFGANAAVIRYSIRFKGYYCLLTSVYPSGLLGDGAPSPSGASGAGDGAVPGVTPPGGAVPHPTPGGVTSAAPPPAPGDEVPPPAPGYPPPPPPDPSAVDPGAPPQPPTPPGSAGSPLPPPDGHMPPPLLPPPPPPPPAGYAPPPAYAPAGAWYPPPPTPVPAPDDPRWRLLLSSGARTMVVVYLVLGVGYLIGGAVAISSIHGSSTSVGGGLSPAFAQVTIAYQTAGTAATTLETSTKACVASPVSQQLACLENADRAFGSALQQYATALQGISVPASASPQARAAIDAAQHAATVLDTLASAPNRQRYSALESAPDLKNALTKVDSTTQALGNALP